MALYLKRAELAVADTTPDPNASAEAVDWFRARVPVPSSRWKQLTAAVRKRAFTVANVTGLDLVTDVWRAIDSAISRGTTFADFKRAIRTSLENNWTGERPSRLVTIFRNNVQSAYSAGRYAQMRDPDVLADRPFWKFEAILDSRTTRICQPLDGIIRAADDAFWNTRYPPLHHLCRSGVSTLSEAQAAHEGGVSRLPAGLRPAQSGWGGNPDLSEWEPDPSNYPPDLWAAFRDRKNE